MKSRTKSVIFLISIAIVFAILNTNYSATTTQQPTDSESSSQSVLIPDRCEVEVKDFESDNKYATRDFTCEEFFNEDLNIYVFPNEDENSRCNRLLISYHFDKEVNINSISLENVKSNRNFKIRNSFKILETYVDKDFYRMVSLYPERTNKVQYFDVFETTNIYMLDVIQTYKSENYSLFGLDLLDAKNECAFQKISFYGEVFIEN